MLVKPHRQREALFSAAGLNSSKGRAGLLASGVAAMAVIASNSQIRTAPEFVREFIDWSNLDNDEFCEHVDAAAVDDSESSSEGFESDSSDSSSRSR